MDFDTLNFDTGETTAAALRKIADALESGELRTEGAERSGNAVRDYLKIHVSFQKVR